MSKRTATPRWGKFLLFSCLTLVVTTGGVFGIGRQWLREASEVSGMQPAGQVLAATDEQPEGLPDALIFRIKTEFLDLMQAQQVQISESLIVDGDTVLNGGLTVEGGAAFAGDIAFDAITVSGDISITDGDITADGSNIDLGDGTITASNIVYEVLAGDGISIDGTQTVTVTNDDRGSAQKIFGKVKVGDVTLTADSNTDTLTLSAGSGVNLGTDTSDNEITISADNLSGWYKPSSTIVSLITSTNNVGIGTSVPTNKLEIDSGSTNVSGLSFTQLTSGSPSGVGGGKVLSLDSGGRVILVTDQTGDTPTAESVLPDAETGGTLYFNGTNWVSSTNLFHNGGSVGISTTSPAGRFHTYTNAIGTIGAVIQGYSGQTANLQEWRNGAGSILSYIDADGVFNGSANVAGSIDPGLTQGQIAFQGADGLAGSNNLFWDNSTGRLGIGTTSPDQLLSINNVGTKPILYISSRYDLTSTLANQGIQMGEGVRRGDIDYNTAHFYFKNYYNSDAANIYFQTKASGTPVNAMTIAGSGNVGIGTTNPTNPLHLLTSSAANPVYINSTNISNRYFTIDRYMNISTSTGINIGYDSNVSTEAYSDSGPLYLTSGYASASTNNIYLDPSGSGNTVISSGNVGIGTTTPTAKLSVIGDVRAFDGTNSLYLTGYGIRGYVAPGDTPKNPWTLTYSNGISNGSTIEVGSSSYGLRFYGGGYNEGGDIQLNVWAGTAANATHTTALIAKASSGNIGIGTTAPAYGFDYYKTTKAGFRLHSDSVNYILSNGNNMTIRAYNSMTFQGPNNGPGYITVKSGSSAGSWVELDTIAADGYLNFKTGGVQTARIINGNVGIGTTSPLYRLDVAGQTGVQGLVLTNTNPMISASDGYMRFYVGNDERVRIDGAYLESNYLRSRGGVGTPLVVRGRSSQTANIFEIENGSGSDLLVVNPDGNVGIGTASPGQALDVVGNARFSAVGSDAYASDLHLTADGTLTTAASDVRLKKDLVELNDDQVLGKLLQLKTYNFAWKSNNSQDIGMVAQEVAQVLPELTFTNPVDGYMGINYSRLPSLLISAMQAQQTQISSLQNSFSIQSDGSLVATTSAQQPKLEQNQTVEEKQSWFSQLAEIVTIFKETVYAKTVRFEALAEFISNTVFRGKARFLGRTDIEGQLAVSANQAGTAEIPAGSRTAKIRFTEPLSQMPSVILTPNSFITGQYRITEKSVEGFTIELSESQSMAVVFDWQALVVVTGQGKPTVEIGKNSEMEQVGANAVNHDVANSELPGLDSENDQSGGDQVQPLTASVSGVVAGESTASGEVVSPTLP